MPDLRVGLLSVSPPAPSAERRPPTAERRVPDVRSLVPGP